MGCNPLVLQIKFKFHSQGCMQSHAVRIRLLLASKYELFFDNPFHLWELTLKCHVVYFLLYPVKSTLQNPYLKVLIYDFYFSESESS